MPSTAYAVCIVVEFTQRYHTPALDTFRATRVGHLVLGSDFDSRDLLAYGIGVAIAVAVDSVLIAPVKRA